MEYLRLFYDIRLKVITALVIGCFSCSSLASDLSTRARARVSR